MDQKEGQEELNAAVQDAETAIEKAVALADKYSLSFAMMEHLYYVGESSHRLTIDDYWNSLYYDALDPKNIDYAKYFDEDGNLLEENYRYAGWQNSSTFC